MLCFTSLYHEFQGPDVRRLFLQTKAASPAAQAPITNPSRFKLDAAFLVAEGDVSAAALPVVAPPVVAPPVVALPGVAVALPVVAPPVVAGGGGVVVLHTKIRER